MRTYGELVFREGKWVITHCEPHVAIKLKAVFPKIYKNQTENFEFPAMPEICRDLAWFIDRYPLSISKADREGLLRGKDLHIIKLDELERIMKPDYQPSFHQLKKELRKYQGIAVDVYLKNQVLLVGDDVGLGKTITAIGGMTQDTLPVLVVVQTHLPWQWKEKVEEFTHLKVHVITGTRPYNLPPADVYIIKYSCLSGWSDIFKMGIFKSACFDEIQELRIAGSQKYDAARNVTRNVQYVMGLSATPIYNYGEEIFNILDLMKSGCLGPRDAFLREWAGGWGRTIIDPQALGTYLRENFLFLRRTRQDVGMELPPVNKIIHTVDHDQRSVDRIQALAEKLAVQATRGTFLERGQAARELDIMVRQATGVAKARSVADYVKILLENDEPVLLAGWHRDVYSIWLEELEKYKPLLYTGSESPKEKEDNRKAFMSGESKLMIISLRSGVGLDGLQDKSSVVVFGELDWSPAVHDQVVGRLNRDGQKQQVTAIYLVSNSGSDPLMVDLLGLKASQAKAIVDPLAGAQVQHTDESRLQLLAKQYLRKTEQLELV